MGNRPIYGSYLEWTIDNLPKGRDGGDGVMRVDLLDAREWLEVLRHVRNAIDQKAYDIARNVLQDMMNDIEDEIEQMDPNVGEGSGSIQD